MPDVRFFLQDLHKKSKLERWFKTMKSSWMAGLRLDDFKFLDELKRSLGEYVNQYNKRVHSSLNGHTPEDNFFKEERQVSADSVIVLNDTEYEVQV